MSAFAYLLDRSVGLPSREYRDNLYSRLSRELLRPSSSSSNFIYRQGMRVWSLALDPVEQRYLLVGTSQSQLLVYDLLTLDDADRVNGTSKYNTTTPLEPLCVVGTKAEAVRTQILQFGISMVDWYPVDSGLCITSSLDQNVKIWDAEHLSCVSTLRLRSKVFGAKFSPISTTHALIAAVTANQEVRLVDMESTATAHTLLGHRDEVWTVEWAPHSEFVLATGSRDGELRLWDIRRSGATACLLCLNAEGKAAIPGRSSLSTHMTKEKRSMSQSAAAPSKKRQRGGSAFHNKVHKRNDPHAAASTSLAMAHYGGIISLAYTPDGRFLLSNGMDGKLRLWNSTSGEHEFMNYQGLQRTQPRAAKNVQMAIGQEGGAWETTVVFIPNGSEGSIASYRVFGDTGAPLGSATAHYQQVTACLYRKATRELYSAGEDGLIMKWKSPPVEFLDPEGQNDDDINTENKESNGVSNAARNDQDAWSDDDDDEDEEDTSHQFIPPILRDDA